MDNYMKSKEGFTLIEVLLALVILSILIVPVFNFFMQSMQYSKLNQQKTVATYAARNALIYLENVDFNSYKDFFDSVKLLEDDAIESIKGINVSIDDSDNKSFIISSELLCGGTVDEALKVNFSNLFPIIDTDGDIIIDEEQSKNKCLTILQPEINGINYSVELTLQDYQPPTEQYVGYFLDHLILVEVLAKWESGFKERQTDKLRGFISHEEIRYRLF